MSAHEQTKAEVMAEIRRGWRDQPPVSQAVLDRSVQIVIAGLREHAQRRPLQHTYLGGAQS